MEHDNLIAGLIRKKKAEITAQVETHQIQLIPTAENIDLCPAARFLRNSMV